MNNISKLTILFLAVALCAFGQLTTTNTTLSAAIPANVNQQWCLASATGVNLPSLSAGRVGSFLGADREVVQVTSQGSTATCFNVKRGQLGTSANQAHSSGVTVFVGNAATGSGDASRPFSGGAFITTTPVGACTRSAQYTLPLWFTGLQASGFMPGTLFDCVGGQWTFGDQISFEAKPNTSFTTLSMPSGIATASVAGVAGTIWSAMINIPQNAVLTGACVLNGITVGTDKVIYALYDSAGALVANTATAGTTTATASKFQCINFTSTVFVYGPKTYWLALQSNGTTDNFQMYAANAAPNNYGTNSQTGTFGTLASITPVTTFTASKGPIGAVY